VKIMKALQNVEYNVRGDDEVGNVKEFITTAR
jgi:hypothetical protein